MSFIQRFTSFLNANTTAGAPRSQQPAVSGSVPGTSSQSNTTASGSQHIERKKVAFHRMRPDEVVSESEEQWKQNGGIMEGETLNTRAITASGQVVDPSELQSVCSICGLFEKDLIRSEISSVPLCHRCKRIFEMPDGREIVVTPREHQKLTCQFNTWERFDLKRTGGRK